jgi:hypothetical protein
MESDAYHVLYSSTCSSSFPLIICDPPGINCYVALAPQALHSTLYNQDYLTFEIDLNDRKGISGLFFTVLILDIHERRDWGGNEVS